MAKLTTIKGPSIHLIQYLSDTPPYNTLEGLAAWAASLGIKALQVPVDPRLIDIHRAAEDQAYCDALKATVAEHGVEISELSTHLAGQLIAVHPAYDVLFDGARGARGHAFAELGKRWLPILDAFDEAGVDVCYEIHPGEDLHDGVTFERFLKHVNDHPRANILYDPSHFLLQQLDYLAFIDIYHDRIKVVHVKDAEFVPDGRQGVYGGYTDWVDRAGHFRALGDGQVDFKGIFTRLAKYGYEGWAVLETECAFKHPADCAKEGAQFITDHIIRVSDGSFDDFAGSGVGPDGLKKILGIK
ncbi:hypothetical protein EVJ58_g2094 [Rhodofomes roseus]|uniref:Xylose isomerase-like TIM barrel domain-containing protein n=1 Tax=Rhodofomes roseus TaxID=34475 RepID=A0A4Y9YSV5_9APHY|nr:hypothetical protein EVJ58_g2094 [Rhodofomes roseus]